MTRTFSLITTTLGLLLCASPACAWDHLMSKEHLQERAQEMLREFPQLEKKRDFGDIAKYRGKRAKSVFVLQKIFKSLDRFDVDTSELRSQLQARAGDGAEALTNRMILSMRPAHLERWATELSEQAEQIDMDPPRLPLDLVPSSVHRYEFGLLLFGGDEAKRSELLSLRARLTERYAAKHRLAYERPKPTEPLFDLLLEDYSQALRDARQKLVGRLSARERLEMAFSDHVPPAHTETALAEKYVDPDPDEEKDIWELLYQSHTVEPGETLESIARRYGVTEPVIALCNNKRPGEHSSLVEPGATLLVPRESQARTVAVRNTNGTLSHWLGSDESTHDVAALYGIPLAQLRRANPKLGKRDWKAGALIKLPPGASTAKVDLLLDGDQVHKLWEERKTGNQADHTAAMKAQPFEDKPLGD